MQAVTISGFAAVHGNGPEAAVAECPLLSRCWGAKRTTARS
jgi:hypothetical protein